jgi:mRNA-degrading endonuclease RelE of RelBE toxin-antitoxin system
VEILHYPSFLKAIKRLKKNEKTDLDNAVRAVASDISIGELKKGDLNGIRVYKFHMVNQLALLAYEYDDVNDELTLLAFGSHENFYRDLKNKNLKINPF